MLRPAPFDTRANLRKVRTNGRALLVCDIYLRDDLFLGPLINRRAAGENRSSGRGRFIEHHGATRVCPDGCVGCNCLVRAAGAQRVSDGGGLRKTVRLSSIHDSNMQPRQRKAVEQMMGGTGIAGLPSVPLHRCLWRAIYVNH